jgi:ribonuclease HI
MEPATKRIHACEGDEEEEQVLSATTLEKELESLQAERVSVEKKHKDVERAYRETLSSIARRQVECEKKLASLKNPAPSDGIGGDESTLTLHFDGASKNNPGQAGAGWILTRENGTCVAYGWKYLGDKHSNNEAEYTGLIEGLAYIQSRPAHLRPKMIKARGDSKLVVMQVQGNWQCRSPNLVAYYEKATASCCALHESGVRLNVEHVLRDQNPIADKLSNLAVKMQSEQVVEGGGSDAVVDVAYLKMRYGA